MAGTDAFSEIIKAACQAAIKEAMNISDLSPRRLLTAQEAAVYLALSEREELDGVRHGRRLMLDIRDLEAWISLHKAA